MLLIMKLTTQGVDQLAPYTDPTPVGLEVLIDFGFVAAMETSSYNRIQAHRGERWQWWIKRNSSKTFRVLVEEWLVA
jgi:hypothetical protein